MSSLQDSSSRRDFIKTGGQAAALSVLANVAIPAVHAAGSDLIQIALVGCGGRGGGAAANALAVKRGPVKLVAMADLFLERLTSDLNRLQQRFPSQVDVPPDPQFLGFDAYKKAMDCLKPGDIVIFATPPAFRWVHFTYAIEKRLNVFMEKPLTADGPASKRMFALAQEASAKNLKVGVGLMSRHSRALQELADRVHNGEIGEIIMQPIEDYIGDFNRGVVALKAVAPSIDSVNDFSKCATERLESYTDSNYGKSRACQSNIVQCLRFMGFFRVVRNSLHICHASGAVPCRNLKRVEMPRAWRDEGTARIK